jgi:hypothetical protein
VIQRDFYLRCPQTLVRWHHPLGEQLALGIKDEKREVAVAIVLLDILGKRVQCFRDVSDGGEHG